MTQPHTETNQVATYGRELDSAVEAVRRAARLCQAVQAGVTPETLQKKDRSPVTVADFGSQALVCRTIREAFPEDPIIAEEDAATLRSEGNEALLERVVAHVEREAPGTTSETACAWIDYGNAAAYSDRFWTLDPIDGTKGFLRGEQYAVALALIVEGTLEVAALACPNLPWRDGEPGGTIFAAIRGEGAIELPVEGGEERRPVRVSDTADAAAARFCESVESAHSAHGAAAEIAERLGITAEPLRLDSQAKYALVARGGADIYLRLPTRAGYVERIWDHAAGALIIAEAGGRVTDIHGRPLSFRHGSGLEQNEGVVATNGRLHDFVLEAVRAVL